MTRKCNKELLTITDIKRSEKDKEVVEGGNTHVHQDGVNSVDLEICLRHSGFHNVLSTFSTTHITPRGNKNKSNTQKITKQPPGQTHKTRHAELL